MVESQPLPAFAIKVYEPSTVYAERVAGRKLAYLDNNVWIELREQATSEAAECLHVCRAAFGEGRVLFPLAFPLVSEAIEIGDLTRRLSHSDLLDELSNGVTFRASHVLFELEAERVCRWLLRGEEVSVQHDEVFTSLPDHIAESSLQFPAGWTPGKVRQFATDLLNEPRLRTVRFIAEQVDWRLAHADHRSRYVSQMRDVLENHRSLPKLRGQQAFSRALLRERVALVKQRLIPATERFLFGDVGPHNAICEMNAWADANGEGGLGRIETIFSRMPMLDQHARIMALHALELARNPAHQDFYDVQHGSIPPVHVDVFATRDGRLADLVRRAGRGRARILGSLRELSDWASLARPIQP